ncbi:MAG: hypothetical protein QME16_00050 [Planctomycetota bacterium]|nr:hypothetical protein [Planctomycetota bacterium]
MTLHLKIIWNEPHLKWLLIFDDDHPEEKFRNKFLMDVWDCVMVNELLGLDKTKANRFKITLEPR